MQLINKDFHITGKHAEIIQSLRKIGLYPDNISIWIEGALTGLYYGRKSEPDSSKESYVDISGRLSFSNRRQLEEILLTYLQHEKKYLNRPLSTSEIFLLNPETHDLNDMINELSQYALYGIEHLGNEFKNILNETNNELILTELINNSYPSADSISTIVAEESSEFYVDQIDSDFSDILKRRE